MPEVGEIVTFKIGNHTSSGIVYMTDSLRSRLFVEVDDQVYELVYADELVRA